MGRSGEQELPRTLKQKDLVEDRNSKSENRTDGSATAPVFCIDEKTKGLENEGFVSNWKFEICKSIVGTKALKGKFPGRVAWTLPPRLKCVKALDKGLTDESYGKATNKGLIAEWRVVGEEWRENLDLSSSFETRAEAFAPRGGSSAVARAITRNGSMAGIQW